MVPTWATEIGASAWASGGPRRPWRGCSPLTRSACDDDGCAGDVGHPRERGWHSPQQQGDGGQWRQPRPHPPPPTGVTAPGSNIATENNKSNAQKKHVKVIHLMQKKNIIVAFCLITLPNKTKYPRREKIKKSSRQGGYRKFGTRAWALCSTIAHWNSKIEMRRRRNHRRTQEEKSDYGKNPSGDETISLDDIPAARAYRFHGVASPRSSGWITLWTDPIHLWLTYYPVGGKILIIKTSF